MSGETGLMDYELGTLVHRCGLCDEPAEMGVPSAHCPFLGEAGCAVMECPPGLGPDPLAETIALEVDDARPDDGFPAVDDLLGRTLGQYRLREVIGRGTMGRVYRGEHGGLGRPCAIKVMNPGLVDRQPRTVERFWAEARAVAGLVHPHIVTVHNLGTDRGYHYMEMEYVEGGVSLAEVLIREGPLEPSRATNLVRQVALALGSAHRSGLVHRDVKPANVLLTAGGLAKLADFGLVRRIGEDRAGAPLAGTPTFMAPELFAGGGASPSTDLYAVGAMFHYLLTGRLPYTADRLDRLIRLHRAAPVPDVRLLAPDVPAEIAAVVARLLAKDPADRPASADDLAEELRAALAHLRDTESLVREALEGVDGVIQQGGRESFRVVVPVAGDRIQEVYVESDIGAQGERLLQVYSVCAPADPRHYEFALTLNAELTIGGLSIRQVHGQPMFVMTRTYARAHATAADVRAAVLEIAARSDKVEQRLTRQDVF